MNIFYIIFLIYFLHADLPTTSVVQRLRTTAISAEPILPDLGVRPSSTIFAKSSADIGSAFELLYAKQSSII